MPRISTLPVCAVVAPCLMATTAFADITATDVWNDWKSYMASSGYDLTASETFSGNTVDATNVVMTMDIEDDGGDGAFTVTLPTLRFVGQADGTVSIEMPAKAEMAMAFSSETEEDVSVIIDLTQNAPSMVAAGDPGDLTYTYGAESMQMVLRNVTVDGVSVGPEIAKVDVTMSDIAQTTRMAVGTLRDIQQEMTVAAVAYDIAFKDPESDDAFELRGQVNNLVLDGSGSVPIDSDPQDLNAMLDDGFAGSGTFRTTGGFYNLSFSGEDGSGTANATSTGSALQVSLAPGGLSYGVTQSGVNMNVLVTEFPLPLSFSAEEIGTKVLMPVQQAPDAQDFQMSVTLGAFTMSDAIWSLFDPGAQLPRNPATLAIDLSGKAKVLFDFLDPAQMSVLEETGAVPGELDTLTLNKLELDAVGARLTGSGDFVFDNSDLTTFDGMPRPEGAVDLKLVGGNGLIDKLVGMGLLPEDQAMGARMMMGLFAVPGEGEDTLNSKIEVNDQGHVLANGQRIR
ncbi:MAG: DUF2125 domain-containing protein [Tateyamaria sp.]